MKLDLDTISKFISMILRHKSEAIDIKLDEHGWANVDENLSMVLQNSIMDLV